MTRTPHDVAIVESVESWVVVYVRGAERKVAAASSKVEAFAAADAFRRGGWTAWAELRSRWAE